MTALTNNALYGAAAISVGDPDFAVSDWHTSLVDALTNMMHAANELNIDIDFDAAFDTARTHYEAELREMQGDF